MDRIEMTGDELAETRALTRAAAGRYGSAESAEFLNDVGVIAHRLPQRLRKALCDFRLFEPASGMIVVVGWPVDERKIGPTPSHWKQHDGGNDTCEEVMFFLLLAALLGDVIGWSTQQDGRLVHDVLPIEAHQHEQVGTGSEELITPHVEDAFHPYRADYVGLMCLRNPDRVPTTVAAISSVRLSEEELAVLSSPHFVIRPDNSHLPANGGGAGSRTPAEEALVRRAYRKIEQRLGHVICPSVG